MPYTRVNWQPGAAGGTPLSADNLNVMDQGIADAHAILDGGLPRSIARATAQLDLGTGDQDVPGCRITLDNGGVYLVTAAVRFLIEAADGVGFARMLQNAFVLDGQVVYDPGTNNYGQATVSQCWIVQAEAGDVLQLQARKSAGNGFSSVQPTDTTVTAVRIGP